MLDSNVFQLHISVRGLVEFILRNGDIDKRMGGGSELAAMQEGSRIHRMIQGKMGPEYEAEVPLFFCVEKDEYSLVVEGRADGVITEPDIITIDEIKGTYRSLEYMREPVPTHLAQAKCYAYMYGIKNDCHNLRIRLTYCNLETEEIRYFYHDESFEELEQWFVNLLEEYDKWAVLKCRAYNRRQESIQSLEFPYPYREGQKELATQVYQTIDQKKKLFLEAPTGVGKTITTVFPSVKAIGMGKADQIFYLTAKTITRTVAQEAFELLRSKGLCFRTVVITAKEKICFCEKKECNPDYCEYAKGHFDRVNAALYDMLCNEEALSRELIEKYAYEYKVCPYELTLDACLFADGIICDYNYVFDPEGKLQRFFGDGAPAGNYIFLIDEAHNLLERGRNMYSAVLIKESFMSLKREIKQEILAEISQITDKAQIEGQLSLDEKGDSVYISSGKKDKKHAKSIFVRNGYADKMVALLEKCNKELLAMKRECEGSRVVQEIDLFVNPLRRLYSTISDYLEERENKTVTIMDSLLDFFFDVAHFLETYELLDENYVKYTQIEDNGDFSIKLFCTNPRENLKSCMRFSRSTILFSATFLPIQYYKKLLGGDSEDYEVYAKSVFDPNKRGLFIANDVTSKYTRRSDEEYEKIAYYVSEIVHSRTGNYLVFSPSHAFMHHIYDIYEAKYAFSDEKCVLQQENMNETDRENFLDMFEQEKSLTAFCALGGIFSEGIDLKNEKLIGSIIIGTGLPQVCFERELLKKHFDDEGENGFDYAYRFPGMNKVLQAAGRVIRTEEDRGVIALLDERFLQTSYTKMFPREWSDYIRINSNSVAEEVMEFWQASDMT